MSKIERNECKKDELINEIISKEWIMFDKTQNIGERAACQDDHDTFYINRYSQFNALSMDTLKSYLKDLLIADLEERNLITEKYGYMMAYTDPEYYKENLQNKLPEFSQKKGILIEKIVADQMESQKRFSEKYPLYNKGARPAEEDSDGNTSIRTYMIGELLTYAEDTLSKFLQDVISDPDMFEKIQDTTVSFYGYESVAAVEEMLAKR